MDPCWPLFRSKHSDRECAEGGFCWVYVIFRFLGRAGALLAPYCLDFEGLGVYFGSFGRHFSYIFARFGEAFVRTVLVSFSKHF